ncbi:MAG TPA: hypothetical protein VKF83_08550 [Stellaceae bacterium]|nr:hypothetical protein [Stellaceae bacterium]
MQYFTGSKARNIALRRIAAARGLKFSECGLFDCTYAQQIRLDSVGLDE